MQLTLKLNNFGRLSRIWVFGYKINQWLVCHNYLIPIVSFDISKNKIIFLQKVQNRGFFFIMRIPLFIRFSFSFLVMTNYIHTYTKGFIQEESNKSSPFIVLKTFIVLFLTLYLDFQFSIYLELKILGSSLIFLFLFVFTTLIIVYYVWSNTLLIDPNIWPFFSDPIIYIVGFVWFLINYLLLLFFA